MGDFGPLFNNRSYHLSIFQYVLIGAIAAFSLFEIHDAEYIIITIMVGYASLFYYLIFSVMIRTKDIEFNTEGMFSEMWQTRVIFILAVWIMYYQGYIEEFYYVLPFMLIGLAGDIFSSLVMFGYIELTDPPDYEDDE